MKDTNDNVYVKKYCLCELRGNIVKIWFFPYLQKWLAFKLESSWKLCILFLLKSKFSHKDIIPLHKEKMVLGSTTSRVPEDLHLDIKMVIMRILSLVKTKETNKKKNLWLLGKNISCKTTFLLVISDSLFYLTKLNIQVIQ